ncbi:MAG: hypothetical protein JOZ50_07670 [Candidatus Eremiobacteraeota bacterium]|nr:hypothetical protein [Candidatus Eremiobacteraeota bacterium]
MVEFRRNALTGEFAFLEINGRFWGSLPLAIEAGLDFPYYEWQILHNMKPAIPSRYKHNLKVRWTMGEIWRLRELWKEDAARKAVGYSRLTAVGHFAASFAPWIRSATFSFSDPIPAISEAASQVVAVLTGVMVKLLPDGVRHAYRQSRQLDRTARAIFYKLWLMRMFGLRSSRKAHLRPNGSWILFICRGNRIRSPLAAALLTSTLRSQDSPFTILSAGTHAAPGSQTDPRATEMAKELGVVISGEPQMVDDKMANDADLIIVMDYALEAEVRARFPDVREKVFLLGEFGTPGRIDPEILDPDAQSPQDFHRTVDCLRAEILELSHFLLVNQRPN